RRLVARGLDHRHHAALGQTVADLDLELLHHAGERRRHFHRRLVRFERHQALVLRDRVADRDQHLDHRHIVVTADVGDSCFLQIGHATLRDARGTRIVAPARGPRQLRHRRGAGKRCALRGGTEGAVSTPQGRNRRERKHWRSVARRGRGCGAHSQPGKAAGRTRGSPPPVAAIPTGWRRVGRAASAWHSVSTHVRRASRAGGGNDLRHAQPPLAAVRLIGRQGSLNPARSEQGRFMRAWPGWPRPSPRGIEQPRGDSPMLSIRTLTLAIAATAAFAPAAFAQDASGDTAAGKRFSVVGGYALTEPTRNPVIDGALTKAEGEGTPTLSAAWNVTDNISVEAWGADKAGYRI